MHRKGSDGVRQLVHIAVGILQSAGADYGEVRTEMIRTVEQRLPPQEPLI
jgi:hypothetical protein